MASAPRLSESETARQGFMAEEDKRVKVIRNVMAAHFIGFIVLGMLLAVGAWPVRSP